MNLGENSLQTSSFGQKTVKPPSTTSLKAFFADVELTRARENAEQPCVERICVRLSWVESRARVGAGEGELVVGWALKRDGKKRRRKGKTRFISGFRENEMK